MHASDDTGHYDAGYSYDTGHQTVFPSHRQLSKAAIFILIYDKDIKPIFHCDAKPFALGPRFG